MDGTGRSKQKWTNPYKSKMLSNVVDGVSQVPGFKFVYLGLWHQYRRVESPSFFFASNSSGTLSEADFFVSSFCSERNSDFTEGSSPVETQFESC